MDMMQKMSGMQGQLNNEGLQLFQQGGGSSGEIQQLGARQRAIRKALEEAMDKTTGNNGMSGRMDQVAEEMKKVADLLDQGKLNSQILKRQQKLFNRLLDSQKSIRQKELSKKRESESAKPYIVTKPHGSIDKNVNIETWERYYKALMKHQFRDQILQQVRQFYEKID